jgi:RNA polymerase sigma-70 factor, ECF subfamily
MIPKDRPGTVWSKLRETAVDSDEANRLARICAYSAEAREWEKFVRAVYPVLEAAARRVGQQWGDTSAATVSEILQEVFLKLCEDNRRILREFEDRGNNSFLKLLRMVTASVGTDYFRKARAGKRGGWNQPVSLEPHSPALEVQDAKAISAVEWPSLMAQLDGLLLGNPKLISPRDRSLFWLYYRQGLTAKAIADIPGLGLSAKGVESVLVRVTRVLREAVESQRPRAQPEQPAEINSPAEKKNKGFSPVVAIDSVKRR